MRKLLAGLTLALCSFTMVADAPWFSGKIIYRNTFTTLDGADISDKLSPIFGSENLYYVSGNNYKTYTEKKQLMQLYTGSNNQSQFFMNGKLVSTTDAAEGTPGAVVTPLTQTATIAGYACQSLQVASEGISIVYFYSPKLRVDPAQYTKHQMGNWITYLNATKGALPLRFTVTNTKQGYVMNSEATAVQPMNLPVDEFTVTAPAR